MSRLSVELMSREEQMINDWCDRALLELLDKIGNRIEFLNILINECGDECKEVLLDRLRKRAKFIEVFESFLSDTIA